MVLRRALQQAIAGAVVRSAKVRERGGSRRCRDRAKTRYSTAIAQLTPRELQVLPYIARGYTDRQTAEILHLSPKTVDVHKTHIMAKLDIHDRVTLARFAIREGLIPVWDE